MKISLENTKDETPANSNNLDNGNDLEGFKPSPPAHKIDDKAAMLEDELQDIKLRFNRERFIYIYIAAFFLVLTIWPSGAGAGLSLIHI